MNGQTQLRNQDLAHKIARLVEERGWNQEEFARLCQLNRQTIRLILLANNGSRRLRNATVSACAKALGLCVSELRALPLERLLPRMNRQQSDKGDSKLRVLYDRATQPHFNAWVEQHPDRAGQMAESEVEEILSLQGTGGPLTEIGVEHFVALIERKRKLIDQVHAVAGTDYIELLEKFVQVLYEKVQPYPDRH